MMLAMQSERTLYLDIKQASQLFSIPQAGLRHLIFSNPEFQRKVVRRIGRKILLNREAFQTFIEGG